MMKKAFLLILLALATYLRAEIYETAHFKDLLTYVDSQTLILLDIDDTLMVPSQSVGTDIWFQHRIKKYVDEGFDHQEAFLQALEDSEGFRHLTKVKLVEEGTDRVINQLQKEGISIMGLSSQNFSLSMCTERHLSSLNINLSKTPPPSEDFYMSTGRGALFRKGILYTTGMPKGKILTDLFKKIGYRPEKVLFVDDKLANLQEVEKWMKAESIPFIGLRYSFCDPRVAAFNPEIANLEFAPFEHILSDSEAKQLLEEKKNRQMASKTAKNPFQYGWDSIKSIFAR